MAVEASSRCLRRVSTAAALPPFCLDNRKCKICVQPRVAESHWWFKRAAASEDGSELERLWRAGRIRPRVFLQAAAATRPRLGCKTVVKQTGLFLFYCLHGMTFVLWLPLPHLFPSPRLSVTGLFDAPCCHFEAQSGVSRLQEKGTRQVETERSEKASLSVCLSLSLGSIMMCARSTRRRTRHNTNTTLVTDFVSCQAVRRSIY